MKKLLLFIPLLLIACTTTKYVQVPVETIKKEYITNTVIDSIIEKDSIDRFISGDTLIIYKEHTKFKYINKIDTIIKQDTITKVVTITEEKVKEVNKIYWWQKALMYLGLLTGLLIIMYIIYKTKIK